MYRRTRSTWTHTSLLGLAALSLLVVGCASAASVDRRTHVPKSQFPMADSDGSSVAAIDTATMRQMAASGAPVDKMAWQTKLKAHAAFLNGGGADGRWQTLSASGLTFAIYSGKSSSGEQAVFRYARFAPGLQLGERSLAFASVVGADLRGLDLRGASLRGLMAIDTDSRAVDFRGADLRGADFSRSDLRGADFRDADLRGADFENCDLRGADFRGAQLEGGRYPGARFSADTDGEL